MCSCLGRWGAAVTEDLTSTYIRREQLECAHSHALCAYWESLREGEALPRLSAFDMLAVPDEAPWMALYDVIDGGRDFRYRLVGTSLALIFTVDKTGRIFSETGPEELAEDYLGAILCEVILRRQPILVVGKVGNVFGRLGLLGESCFLPLVGEDDQIRRVVHMIRLLSEEDKWME